MNLRKLRYIVGMLTIPSFVFAQDSLAMLEFNDYLSLVLQNHPVIRQSELRPQMAEAEVRMAKGLLDPKLEFSQSVKNFKDKTYYDLLNTTLKIPTWLPLDPKISFERNEGEFLNPMDGLPSDSENRQLTAGLSLPVGRGLFIDERRAVIQQAKIYQSVAMAEQVKIANKLMFTVIKDYLEWSLAYQELQLLEQSIKIAEELYRRVRLDYNFGEAAVVDTVQALITLQTRQADYQKFQYEYIAAGLKLSNHLWSEEGSPLEIQSNVIPNTSIVWKDTPDASQVEELKLWAMDNHPDIQKIRGKSDQLSVENRLAKEYLKPAVDLSYSFIDAPINPNGEFVNPSFGDNYKMGIDVYFPLLLRKERGKLALTEIKLQDISYETDYLKLNISNTVSSKYAELITAQNLTDQYHLMAENYERLLDAELLNLETGESDLFKLNIQQDKFIDSQLKYLFNLTKFQKLKAELLYEAGNLFETIEAVSN